MLRHFPFHDKFDLRMGTSPLAEAEPIIECDEHYLVEVALKRKLLTDDHRYYFRAADGTEQAQWEVLALVLENLLRFYPDKFELRKRDDEWHWTNKRLGETHRFVFGDTESLPLPLDWVGKQVQEDLIILNPSLHVVAGQLCFPSGWDLDEKFEKHFMAVHEPLPPVTNPMIEMANKFIDRLPVGKTFQRNNWGFRVSDELDLSSRHSAQYARLLQAAANIMTPETAGQMIFVRIEHQTLSRLPLSGHVLFTIRTYQSRLEEEVHDLTRARTLLSFLKGVPEELQAYKLIQQYMPQLLTYLEKVTR